MIRVGDLTGAKRRETGRFARILSNDVGPRAEYDQPLLEVENCVVVPTLGSILPRWVLIVPRSKLMNFAQWRGDAGSEPAELARAVLDRFGVSGNRAIWFEHGASKEDTSLACGVDHAHLHVVIDAPFTFDDFASATEGLADLSWSSLHVSELYRPLTGQNSYLLAASGERGIRAENVKIAGSQFFRRAIANLVGRPNEWDYRVHPNLGNVRETLGMFGSRATEFICP